MKESVRGLQTSKRRSDPPKRNASHGACLTPTSSGSSFRWTSAGEDRHGDEATGAAHLSSSCDWDRPNWQRAGTSHCCRRPMHPSSVEERDVSDPCHACRSNQGSYFAVGAEAIDVRVWQVVAQNGIRVRVGGVHIVAREILCGAGNADHSSRLRARAGDEDGEGDGENDDESVHDGREVLCGRSVEWCSERWSSALGCRKLDEIIPGFIGQRAERAATVCQPLE